MNILIVEDEAPAARRLQKMVSELEPAAVFAGHTDGIRSTVCWLETNVAPDLVLMDIQLSDGISFEIFNRTTISSPVIFTTAYDEYAVRAFKVNSIDYLLKPVDKTELRRSFDRFRERRAPVPGSQDLFRKLVNEMQTGKPVFKTRFLVSKGPDLFPVESSQAAFFHTEERVVFMHTHDGKRYIIEHTLDELESLLDPAVFCRANRQFILSASCVRSMQAGFNGKIKAFVHPQPPEEIIVSRERAVAFKEWLNR
ncbi:MAG: LytTR family two component transcriptional regulator [Bacteroidetes bacterium]|nr:MAG: LytTR family two component transcriptional regulator [Bacteroidota bacterium]